MRNVTVIAVAAWLATLWSISPAAQGGRGQGSPASVRPPQTTTAQQYPKEQVDTGRTRFAAQCGFCHGRDAGGGETGPDLTRSELVAADVRGNQIAPLIRSGRPDKGMPSFTLPDADVAAIVAFIHDQKTQADNAVGGRRTVDAADLQTGNAAVGQRYFATSCARCHSATGDLKGVATRIAQPLTLLQRMLYPAPAPAGRGGPDPSRIAQTVTVTVKSGDKVSGKLAYRDEFTIALFDAGGFEHSWPTSQVTFTVDDPLQAHIDQLAKYTDADMHDVLAYLLTLK